MICRLLARIRDLLRGYRDYIPVCRRCGYLERDHYLDEAEWRDAGAPNVCDMFLPGWRRR